MAAPNTAPDAFEEIQLNDDVAGYLRASELSRERVEDARNLLREGDEVSVMIINVDRKAHSIQMSLKAKDAAGQQEQKPRLSQTSERENAGTTSQGALLRVKLDNRELGFYPRPMDEVQRPPPRGLPNSTGGPGSGWAASICTAPPGHLRWPVPGGDKLDRHVVVHPIS